MILEIISDFGNFTQYTLMENSKRTLHAVNSQCSFSSGNQGGKFAVILIYRSSTVIVWHHLAAWANFGTHSNKLTWIEDVNQRALLCPVGFSHKADSEFVGPAPKVTSKRLLQLDWICRYTTRSLNEKLSIESFENSFCYRTLMWQICAFQNLKMSQMNTRMKNDEINYRK